MAPTKHYRWGLVKLFVNYFNCVLCVEICLRLLSSAFCHFISLCFMFVSVSFCVTILVPNSANLNHLFLLNISNLMQKKNSSFRHCTSKWEYRLLPGNAQALTLWTIFVHCNTDLSFLCKCQANEVTTNMFSTGFRLLVSTQILYIIIFYYDVSLCCNTLLCF